MEYFRSLTCIVFVLSFIYPLTVFPFMVSPDGEDIPEECAYFASFQDATETIKLMLQTDEYLNLQVASNFAKNLISMPLTPEDNAYSKAVINAGATNYNNLVKDLANVHNYRHDTCIERIIKELESYLRLHNYEVCTQYKTRMSSYFSTDNIDCLPPATCTQCTSGPNCTEADTPTKCANGERFCMTSTIQSSGGRQVFRKCSDEPECRLNHVGVPDCLLINNGGAGFEYDCHFCCVGYNCNKGPSVVPPKDTHYNKTSTA